MRPPVDAPHPRATRSRALGSWLAAGCGVVVGLAALAPGGADALTLTESMAAAYNNNPTLLSQRAKLREADENIPQALSNWRPTVQFTGSAGFDRRESNAPPGSFNTVTEGNPQTLAPRNLDLTVTQPLYRGGRTVAATSEAENQVRATRAQTIATEEQVLFGVVQSYMDVVQNQAVLDLSINNEQVLRRQLEAAQDRFRVGEITRTDVAQAESRLAAATADRVQAEGNLETSRAAFERFVGEPPGLLKPPTERPVLPTSRAEVTQLASNDNPNVVAAQYTEASARDAVGVIRGQLLPQISIVGDANRAEESEISRRVDNSFSVIARMTVPLYEGGSVYSQTRQAIETVGERRSEIDDARRAAVQTAQADWETLVATRARIDSLQSTIRAAQIALEGVQQEAAVGARTVLDILDAEQELFTDRVNLVQAQRNEVVTEFDLAQQVGRLTAVDMKLPVELYDFNKHYKQVRDKWIGFDPKE